MSLPIILLVLATNAAHSQAAVRSGVDVSRATVGDPITITITVEHDSSSVVRWPELEVVGAFEVLEVRDQPTIRAERQVTSVRQLVVAAFELGELEIPAIEITVESPVADAGTTVSTQPTRVTIESVGLDDGGEIRDIKPPLALARNWAALVAWLVCGLGFGALAWWAYRRWQRRRTPDADHPIAQPRPPHEVAREALRRLQTSGMLERGELKRYFSEASDIVRVYLEGRYTIIAMEMTTRDIDAALDGVPLAFELRQQFHSFFARCDLVKFAKFHPAPADCAALVPTALDVVAASQPPPAEDIDIEPARVAAARARRSA